MKIEIGADFPQYFKPSYPEEFELFHHFEVTAGYRPFYLPSPRGRKTDSQTSASIRGAVSTVTRPLSSQ